MILKIKKIHPDAIIPSYAHNEGDSGFDLCSTKDYTLKPQERKVFPTGLTIELPIGYEMQIRPRSGLALKHGITVLNTPGTVDASYRGEVGVILINLSNEEYAVKNKERIAQGVISRVERVVMEEVKELSKSSRGEGGFGSTG